MFFNCPSSHKEWFHTNTDKHDRNTATRRHARCAARHYDQSVAVHQSAVRWFYRQHSDGGIPWRRIFKNIYGKNSGSSQPWRYITINMFAHFEKQISFHRGSVGVFRSRTHRSQFGTENVHWPFFITANGWTVLHERQQSTNRYSCASAVRPIAWWFGKFQINDQRISKQISNRHQITV